MNPSPFYLYNIKSRLLFTLMLPSIISPTALNAYHLPFILSEQLLTILQSWLSQYHLPFQFIHLFSNAYPSWPKKYHSLFIYFHSLLGYVPSPRSYHHPHLSLIHLGLANVTLVSIPAAINCPIFLCPKLLYNSTYHVSYTKQTSTITAAILVCFNS